MRNQTKSIPLDTLLGLESLSVYNEVKAQESDNQEKLFYFSVNLQIARAIPFIYDAVRERASDAQELDSGIEAVIELHKAYNRHIETQFKQLESEILGGNNA